METVNNSFSFKLTSSQKEQILKWHLPPLLDRLQYKHSAECVYMEGELSVEQKLAWFYISSKTVFPLFAAKEPLGFLVLSTLLDYTSAEETRTLIDQVLQENLNSLCINGFKKQNSQPVFPILIQKNKEEEILKTAHDLYLKSSELAFLNGNELQWTDNVFNKIEGLFICIPSFYNLAGFQKNILINSLPILTSAVLALGQPVDQELPEEVRTVFHLYSG